MLFLDEQRRGPPPSWTRWVSTSWSRNSVAGLRTLHAFAVSARDRSCRRMGWLVCQHRVSRSDL